MNSIKVLQNPEETAEICEDAKSDHSALPIVCVNV